MSMSVLTGEPVQERPADPTRIRIKALVREDAEAVLAMLGRCSPDTLYRRFHGVTDGHAHVARVLANIPGQDAYVAWSGGRCVGLASMAIDDDGSTHIGVLVEDRWQRRGAGSALTATLVARARQLGVGSLVADVLADNRFIVPLLGRIGPITASFDSGGATVRLGLEAGWVNGHTATAAAGPKAIDHRSAVATATSGPGSA